MKNSKIIINEEIENGNFFAWNDGDGGLSEALSRGNVAKTYNEARDELAEELYPDSKFTWQQESFTKGEWYEHCCKGNYSDEACHTWIYNLEEYLENEF